MTLGKKTKSIQMKVWQTDRPYASSNNSEKLENMSSTYPKRRKRIVSLFIDTISLSTEEHECSVTTYIRLIWNVLHLKSRARR